MNWTSSLCLRSFTRYSGTTVHLYSYDPNFDPKIQGCVCHDANEYLPHELYERVRSANERAYGGRCGYREGADLFRYKLLYEKGGWYFDTDCLLLRPLTPLFDRDYVFGWELPTSVNNAVLKFPKGDPLLEQISNECLQRSPLTCLPGTVALFTQYLKKFNLIDQVLPRNYFYAISPIQKEQQSVPEEECSYLLHLYNSLTLEMQIEALNSLALKIARNIPLGKEIREFFDRYVGNRQVYAGRVGIRQDGGLLGSPISNNAQVPIELIAGLRDFTARWERYIEQDQTRWDKSNFCLEDAKFQANLLSGYLLNAHHEHWDSVNKADFNSLVRYLSAFASWTTFSGDSNFLGMDETGNTAYDFANRLIASCCAKTVS